MVTLPSNISSDLIVHKYKTCTALLTKTCSQQPGFPLGIRHMGENFFKPKNQYLAFMGPKCHVRGLE